jgi:selenocysteine lyase/cysteine desulfurase
VYYLNHAAVAPWPRRSAEAVRRFAEENVRQGSKNYPAWLATETQLREQLAGLINAPDYNDIALLKNTSEALSVVAYGLTWHAGQNIVISDQEFPSNRIVWESLQHYGVELRRVDLATGPSPEQSLIDATDANTRLLAVSSVQYATGLRMKLEQLGEHCRANHILFCVDAIQSIGALQFDVQHINADFVMADGHKWMLGPEGLALFYCRADLRDQLILRQFGWHMVEHHNDYDRLDWHAANSARRFECGSPNLLGAHALNASLSLLEDVGMPQVESRVLRNSQRLFELIAESRNLSAITLNTPERFAGIVTFKHERLDSARLYHALQQGGVMCAQRGGGIRYSPHFYTPQSVLEHAVALADNLE